jgi:biopolymer transport protein ExbD
VRFATRLKPRRVLREAIVPMVNLVFLLLIFFLLTATASPAPPFDLRLPEGGAVLDAGGTTALFVGPDGALAYGGSRGNAIFATIRARQMRGPLEIRADGEVPAAEIATLLARLAQAGIRETRLVLVRP